MPVLRRVALTLPLLSVFLCSQPAAALTESDRNLYREAFAAAGHGQWSYAWARAEKAHDRLPAEALHWLDYTRGGTGASFAEIAAFIADHPDWPGQKLLRQRAEEQMDSASDATAAAWFERFPPLTAPAKLRQADIWMAAGKREAALQRIREVWIGGTFSAFEEKTLLQRYHGVLRKVDHDKRLDRLLWDDESEAAHRMMRLVDADHRALAEARLALAAMSPGAERLLGRVPADLQQDAGLLYERVRWRRRKELYDGAVELLQQAPADLVRPAAWANERQILARRVLAEGNPALAYRLAAHHQLSDGPLFAELEFFVGWVALRWLKQPDTAYNHFVHLFDQVKLPISSSRGAYWAARAAEAMHMTPLAQTWYRTAAERVTTYYGQLAATHLGASPGKALNEPHPSPEETAAFNKRDLVRVVRDLAEADASDYVRPFVLRVADLAKTPGEHALAARLAGEAGRPDLAVAAAKKASYAGVTLLAEGYPMADLPAGGHVERPLLLAMTRQESAFDGEAVSRAGARGLMQLMPATASHVAKSLGLSFSAKRLTNDRRYNVTLGRAYLGNLISDFAGSYVLAIAAYNAGPARVREWMDDFGDPRRKGVDVVDWIESIPFGETRNYVQRVLENLQVYRLRVGDRSLAFSLASDLKR